MKCNISFIKNSFDLSQSIEKVTESFTEASELIAKMSTEFVIFSKSNDFDESIAMAIACRDFNETGHLYSVAYDRNMSSTYKVDRNSEDLIGIVNSSPPILDGRWIGIYKDSNRIGIVDHPIRIIFNEMSLVTYCSKILVKNRMPHNDLALSFKNIYKNLIFRTNELQDELLFNRLNNMDGDYQDFIFSITTCLEFFNNYSVIPDDSLKNIECINSALKIPVSPEGKGKGKRNNNELKRDFYIDKKKYENVNCEFHCKLQYPDRALGNGKPKPNRIYFGFIENKIGIAHIGEHW